MSEQNIPEWAQALQVQTTIETGSDAHETPKTVLSDAERISTARAVAIQHDSESNADPNFGGQHTSAFFQDYGHGVLAGRRVISLAQLIDTRIGGPSDSSREGR